MYMYTIISNHGPASTYSILIINTNASSVTSCWKILFCSTRSVTVTASALNNMIG